jgi:hypothetical protein
MLEVIHDIAPGAQLYFATAFTGQAQFAQNIRDLRTAGCDIIVDDVFYTIETPFQDGQLPSVTSNTLGGVIAQAVNDVTSSGALYFSSAGNQGNINDNTAGVWEGDFVDGGDAPTVMGGVIGGPVAGRVHQFTAHPSQPAPQPSRPRTIKSLLEQESQSVSFGPTRSEHPATTMIFTLRTPPAILFWGHLKTRRTALRTRRNRLPRRPMLSATESLS